MKFCMQCGHELGASRTCRSCGTTAPVEPLPAPQLPPAGARYPLFADEVDSVSVSTSGRVLAAPVDEPLAAPTVAVPTVQPAPTVHPAQPEPRRSDFDHLDLADLDGLDHPVAEDETRVRLPSVPVVPSRRRGMAVVWLVLVALVVGALFLGARLLLGGGDKPSEPGRTASRTAGSAPAGDDLASTATAKAPVTRQPGVDTHGARTTYDASNMLDGDATTAWEMPGDGTGKELTFTLAAKTRLTSVGLVNGYAKSAKEDGRTIDWYAGNRRVLAVEWLFDDGTTQVQDLRETRSLQRVDVDATTTTVRLRLVKVSAPGKGTAARDMTPISEVALAGSAG